MTRHKSTFDSLLILTTLRDQILTAADDKTVRLFDVASGQEVNRMDIPSNPTDLELSQDSSVITVSFGKRLSLALWARRTGIPDVITGLTLLTQLLTLHDLLRSVVCSLAHLLPSTWESE